MSPQFLDFSDSKTANSKCESSAHRVFVAPDGPSSRATWEAGAYHRTNRVPSHAPG